MPKNIDKIPPDSQMSDVIKKGLQIAAEVLADDEPELVQEVFVTIPESEVLRKVLDRDRTSAIVHGGLKGILGLTDDEARTLIGFLRKI